MSTTDIYLIQTLLIKNNSIFIKPLYQSLWCIYFLYDTPLLSTTTWETWQMEKEQQFTGRTGNQMRSSQRSI